MDIAGRRHGGHPEHMYESSLLRAQSWNKPWYKLKHWFQWQVHTNYRIHTNKSVFSFTFCHLLCQAPEIYKETEHPVQLDQKPTSCVETDISTATQCSSSMWPELHVCRALSLGGGLSRARGPGEDVGMGCRAWRSREGSEARKKAVWGGWRKVTKASFFVKKFGINLELDPKVCGSPS